MLRVDVKHTTSVNLSKPLIAYITSNYGKTKLPLLEAAANDIQQAREMVKRAVSSKQIGEAERAIMELREYASMLQGLKSRFPFGEHSSGSIFRKKKVSTVMVSFSWSDAFRSEKIMNTFDLNVEFSSIVFNMGAFYNIMGTHQDRTTPESAQAAAKHFMTAAGVFEMMSSTLSLPPTNFCLDLSTSSLKALSLMNLAQAACCSFESAVMKKMKPAVLAVLAQGASDAYDRARDVLRSDEQLTAWLSKGNVKYLQHFTYQKRCLAAAAQFWQAHKDEEDDKYGDVVARYLHAKSVAESAAKYEYPNASIAEKRKAMLASISHKLASAQKDNDTIYHYPVKKIEDLPSISSKVIVKPVPFALPDARLPAAFDEMVPLVLQNAIDRFKTELGDEIGEITATCSESTDAAKAALEEMNLPAALDASESKVKLPEDLWRQVQTAQASQDLETLRLKIRETAQQCWSMHKEISSMLDEESQQELQFRNLHGTRWDRTPSHEISGSYRDDLRTAMDYLMQARSADEKVDKDMSLNRLDLQLLAKSKEELEALIPDLEENSVESETSEELRSLLRKLSSLLNKRDKLINNFIEAVETHDVAAIVLPKINIADVDELLLQEKHSFQDRRDAINANLHKQSELIDEIVEANQKRLAQSQRQPSQVKIRAEALSKISAAVSAHGKLMRDTAEGERFYAQLLANFLLPLQDSVKGFVVARQHEARLLLDELARQFSSQASLSHPGPSQNYPSFNSSRGQGGPDDSSGFPSAPSAPSL